MRDCANGSLDETFDSDGKVLTDIGRPSSDVGRDVVVTVQGDGKVIVVGSSVQTGTGNDLRLCVTTPTAVDASFGQGGKVTTDFGATYDDGRAVAIQSDGRIVVVGALPRAAQRALCRRDDSNGSLDTTFGQDLDGNGILDGKVITAIGLADAAVAVAVHVDKIVVEAFDEADPPPGTTLPWLATTAMEAWTRPSTATARWRLISGPGTRKPLAWRSMRPATSWWPDTPTSALSVGGTAYDFALVRLSDGTPDTSFDGDGKLLTNFASYNDMPYGVVIDGNGKIVAAGYSYRGYGGWDFALRYNTDGGLDTGFGTGGKVITNFGWQDDQAMDVAIDAAGKIVAAGGTYRNTTGWHFAVWYNLDGTLHAGFGTGGKVTTDFGWEDIGYGVAIAGDKIVVAGYSVQVATEADFAVVRDRTGVEVGAITAAVDPIEVNTQVSALASFADAGVPDTHTAALGLGRRHHLGRDSDGRTNGSGSATGNHIYSCRGRLHCDADGDRQWRGLRPVRLPVRRGLRSRRRLCHRRRLDQLAGGRVCRRIRRSTGKATFGFVSKYQKGANVPDRQHRVPVQGRPT